MEVEAEVVRCEEEENGENGEGGCRALSVKMEEGVRIFNKERREGVFG